MFIACTILVARWFPAYSASERLRTFQFDRLRAFLVQRLSITLPNSWVEAPVGTQYHILDGATNGAPTLLNKADSSLIGFSIVHDPKGALGRDYLDLYSNLNKKALALPVIQLNGSKAYPYYISKEKGLKGTKAGRVYRLTDQDNIIGKPSNPLFKPSQFSNDVRHFANVFLPLKDKFILITYSGPNRKGFHEFLSYLPSLKW